MTKTQADYLKFFLIGILGILTVPFSFRFVITQPLFYVGIAILIVYFVWDKYGRPKEKELRSFTAPAIIIVTSLLVLSIFGNLIHAKWGIIDDHEIMRYLGEDSQMKFSEWPALYSQSEGMKPGLLLRYRPSYQALRLAETALWDNHPGLWYATRLVIFIFFLSVIWYVTTPIIGFVGGGLFVTYIFAFDYWKDIWARLGPSETYAVLGLALYIFFYNKILRRKSISWQTWLGLLIGGIIAIGSKENMVLLIIPTVFLWLWVLYTKKARLVGHVVLACLTLFSLFVSASVIQAVSRSGQDVYAASTSTSSRAQVLIVSLKTHQAKELLITIFLGVIVCVYSLFKIKDRELSIKTLTLLILLGSVLFLFISQFIFYNGNWPDHNRYDFPGMLYDPAYYLCLIWFFNYLLRKIDLEKSLFLGLKYAVFVGAILLIIMKGFVATKVVVAENISKTQGYTATIIKLADQLKESPQTPVVFESSLVWDYEPIFSYEVFLRSHGVKNPFYLRLSSYTPATVAPGLEKNLAEQLTSISQNGNDLFHPLGQLPPSNCYSLIISGVPKTTCKLLN